MDGYRVNTTRLAACASDMHNIMNELYRIQTALDSVSKLNMDFSSATLVSLKNKVKKYKGKIGEYRQYSWEYKNKLDEIISLYEKNEYGLSGVGVEESCLSDSSVSSNDIIEFLKKLGVELPLIVITGTIGGVIGGVPGAILGTIIGNLIDGSNSNDIYNTFLDGITDKYTDTGMPLYYRNTLGQLYDNVSPEYDYAKEIFDKHKNKLQITDYSYNGTAEHKNGKMKVNAYEDDNNVRGAGQAFYHEYGHFIVYEEGWVKGNSVTSEFKVFEDTVKKEIQEYIIAFETEAQKEGFKTEEGVKHRALELMREELGKNNYNVYNGISDIIDGVSELRYRRNTYDITYSHDNDYWLKNENNAIIGNETFAHIYAAMMTGDEKELSKMKEIMPESITLFQKMIESRL